MVSSDLYTIGGLLLSVLGFVVGWFKFRIEGAKSRQEEYRFAKEFFADVDDNPGCRPLLWERGFYALSGVADVPVSLVRSLIDASGPAWTAIRRYKKAGRYCLEFDMANEKLRWKRQYATAPRRWLFIAAWIAWYVAGISLGWFAFQLLVTPLVPAPPASIIMSALILIVLFGSAALALISVVRMIDAQGLMRQLYGEPKTTWLVSRFLGRMLDRFSRPPPLVQ